MKVALEMEPSQNMDVMEEGAAFPDGDEHFPSK